MEIFGIKYYSTAEVLKMFEISNDTWRGWREKYGIIGHYMRGTHFYSEDSLRQLMERNKVTGVAHKEKKGEDK